MGRFSLAWSKVQIYSHMLSIRLGSAKEIWTPKRHVVSDQTDFAMPSVGRAWLRSGALEPSVMFSEILTAAAWIRIYRGNVLPIAADISMRL